MRILTSIDIDAPPDVVWAVLQDVGSYGSWSPFMTRVEGRLAVGEKLTLHVVLGGSKQRSKHTVSRVDGPEALCWTIRTRRPWLMHGERCQTLEALPDGRTRYHNDEQVHGLVAPLVAWFMRAKVQAGLEAHGEALKQRVEATPAGARPSS